MLTNKALKSFKRGNNFQIRESKMISYILLFLTL